MKRLAWYFFLETKKMLLQLPKLLLGSMLFLAITAGCIFTFQYGVQKQTTNPPIYIGVLADEDEPFIDWMIKTIENMPDMAYSFQIERVDQCTADDNFFANDSNILFIVPKNYISSIIYGQNKHLTIRFSKAQTTIVNTLIRELSGAASSFILDTEAAIYTMQDYYRTYHLTDPEKDEFKLNVTFVQEIVNFTNSIQAEVPDTFQAEGTPSAYVASILVLLPLFFGLIAAPAMTSESLTLKRQLILFRIGICKQLFARLLTFVLLLFLLSLVPGLSFVFAQARGFSPLSGTLLEDGTGTVFLLFAVLPVYLLTASFCLMIYELTTDSMSSILLLFVSTILAGLCSGFFYPLAYLPGVIKKLAPFLPTTHARAYILNVLQRQNLWHAILPVMFDAILFFILSILISHRRQT